MRWAWRVAATAAVLTGLLVAAGVALVAVASTGTTVALVGVGGVVALAAAMLGALIARRSAESGVVGALLTLVGLNVAFTSAREAGWVVLANRPVTLARVDWLVAGLAESSVWLLVALALLLLYFPDGRLPGRRWRAVPPVLIVAGLAHHAWGVVEPMPFRTPLEGLPRPFPPLPAIVEAVSVVAFVTLIGLLLACAGSLVVRFRRADPLHRTQIKWLAVAGLGLPAFVIICLTEVVVRGRPAWLSAAIGAGTILGVPAAVGIAVLRHDLYDIDKMLAATVSYGAVTAVLLCVFAAASFTTGVTLGRESTAAAAGVTALSALALSPARRRLQRRVDRRLYPLRPAALHTIADLQRRIHAGEAQPEQLEAVLRKALRDPGLRVGYRVLGAIRLVDAGGVEVDPGGAVSVVAGGDVIAALVPASSAVSVELLREVAQACATLAEVVSLRSELTAALREVEASRARLVHASDEERRRLERDLHDGAQQRLVSLGMARRLSQRRRDEGTVGVDGLLDQTVAELGTAVAELRQIAHGLRPSSLDDGLHAALGAVTQHVPVPVVLDVPADPLPENVATTAYFVASEAITNAVKHAGASRIEVHVTRCNGRVEVRVADDGRGGAAVHPGSGLAGLRDRVDALGGELALDSPPGRGTRVEVVLPCVS